MKIQKKPLALARGEVTELYNYMSVVQYRGRMLIPRHIRKELGIQSGDRLDIWVEGDWIHISKEINQPLGSGDIES